MENKVHVIIAAASDGVLAKLIVDSYKEVEKNFYLKSWKTSELDAGHFVEGVRRFIEHRLFGKYTPISSTISSFSDQVLKQYEAVTGGNDSYRILIPRLLYGAYAIRNKRGVGHVGPVSPNYMDAVYVLSACQWVLAEITRLESGLSPDETAKMIEKLVEREIEGIWEGRILAKNLKLKEAILFLLFDRSPQSSTELFKGTENKTEKYFLRELRKLHDAKLLTLNPDGNCVISPTGRREAEKIVGKMTI